MPRPTSTTTTRRRPAPFFIPYDPPPTLTLTEQDDEAFLAHLAGELQATESEDNTPTFTEDE